MPATVHGIYQKYSDNAARVHTVTIEADEDPDYPAELLVDDNPAHVAKIANTSGAIVVSSASKIPAQLVGLIHTSLDEGADVEIQGDDSASWGSPAFSAAITVPAWRGAGVTRWPVNPWLDLTLAAGYDAAGWKAWRIAITSNSQNIEIGQLWLGSTIRRYDPNVDWGASQEWERLNTVNTTGFGVKHRTRRGTVIWRRTARIEDCPDTLRASLQDHVDDVDGDTYPWLLIPDGTVNDARLVTYTDPKYALVERITNSSTVQLNVEEVARGLRPGV